jgi:hypothetical protein
MSGRSISTTSPAPGPHVLCSTAAVLGPAGTLTCKDLSPTFYAELGTEFGSFAGHALIATHEYETDWPGWEKHPKGDEFVYLLFGDTDFVFWRNGAEETIRLHAPGSYVVVPRDTWHTARPRIRTGLLFVTPGEDTQHTARPGD